MLPGLLILGWIISEVMRRRRLATFGDPEVLEVSTPWTARIAALLLLLFGIACAVAVIALPERKEVGKPQAAPGIRILVDLQSLANGGEQVWEAFDISLQSVLDQAQGVLFSAAIAGSPGELTVYPTEDAKGLQIILARLRYESWHQNPPDLAQALAKQLGMQRVQAPNLRFIVVTTMAPDEVARLVSALQDKATDVIFIRISPSGQPVHFGTKAVAGSLVWTTNVADILPFLRPDPGRDRQNAVIELTQWLALAALVLLCAEFLVSLCARLRAGRSPVA